MYFSNYDELIKKAKNNGVCPRIAVACAGDPHTIEAVLRATADGLVKPVLVGIKTDILDAVAQVKRENPALNAINVADSDIYDVEGLPEGAAKAVSLVNEGKADFLMKGKVDTSVFLKAVVNKETGLNTGNLMNHVAFYEIPAYHKLMVNVDGGMIAYPTLEQKKKIIENTVGVLHTLGYDCPKVGVLACVEKVNPKMPETVEADELKQMNQRGEITGCIVEGPISYDCAVSREIADFKGYKSECAGDCDVFLVPNIHTGNIMGKALSCHANARMAGFVVGAKCPVILSSRGATSDEKYLSIAVASAASLKE